MDNLELALTIDLKEFLSSISKIPGVSQETVAKLQQIFNSVTPPKVTPTDTDRANRELLALRESYLTVSVAQGEGEKNTIAWANSMMLSTSQIDKLISSLQQELSTLVIASPEYDKVRARVMSLTQAKQTLTLAQGRMRASTTSLNYIIRDSPFFFQRFDMGILAVSNNLNPFIDDMLRAKAVTGTWKAAIGTLTSGLVGIGGLSIAFSLVVAAIQAFSFATSNSKEEVKKAKDEIKEYRKELEKMSKASLDNALTLNLMQQSKLVQEVNKGNGQLTEEQLKQSRVLKDQEAEIRKMIATIGDLNNLTNERSELEKKIKDLRNVDASQGPLSPRNVKLLADYNGRLKEIDKQINQLNGKDTKTKDDSFKTDAELRKEISLLDVKIKNAKSEGEALRYLEERIEKQKQLNYLMYSMLELVDTIRKQEKDLGKNDYLKYAKNDLKSFKPMDKVDVPTKPQAFSETNVELERMLTLSNLLTDSFNQAGQAVASAAASGISLFKQENSLLQIFINGLIRAAAEALTLKLITAGLNFIGSAIGIPGLGDVATSATAAASSVSPGITSDISYSGASPLNKFATNTTYSGLSNYSTPMVSTRIIEKVVPIVLDSELSGRNLKLVQKNFDQYRKLYAGYTGD